MPNGISEIDVLYQELDFSSEHSPVATKLALPTFRVPVAVRSDKKPAKHWFQFTRFWEFTSFQGDSAQPNLAALCVVVRQVTVCTESIQTLGAAKRQTSLDRVSAGRQCELESSLRPQ